MNPKIHKWREIELSESPILLLGNGASRAIDEKAFGYDALLEKTNLNDGSKEIFKSVGHSDFERVLERLEITKVTNQSLCINESMTAKTIEEIREGLIYAVRKIHPPQKDAVSDELAGKAIKFMENFKAVFTLNYDFFLCWLINIANGVGSEKYFKDGFWDDRKFGHSWPAGMYEPRDGKPSVACYFMHGALHLVNEPEKKIRGWNMQS